MAEQYTSSGTLASSVLELTQMLTKNNQELKEPAIGIDLLRRRHGLRAPAAALSSRRGAAGRGAVYPLTLAMNLKAAIAAWPRSVWPLTVSPRQAWVPTRDANREGVQRRASE